MRVAFSFFAAALFCSSIAFSPVVNAQGAQVEVDGEALKNLLEAMILKQGVDIMVQNIKASERESGDLNKAIRATLGISVADIQKYGLLGGPNSEMRKLFKGVEFRRLG